MRNAIRIMGSMVIALTMSWQAAGANSKVSALTADASPTSDDLIYTVDDPGGSPASKKATLANVRTLMNTDIGDLNLNADSELTISSGAVTATQSFHSIDTEGDAADDDLDTINGGTDGDVLWLTPANDARDVWITPAGNIDTPSGRKYPIPRGTAAGLIYDGTNWRLVYCGDWGFTHDHTISITDDPITAAQIQTVISLYPRHVPQGVDIVWQFGDGTYDDTMTSALTWDGFFGGGTMTIQGNTGEANATTLHTTQSVILDFSAGTSGGIVLLNNSVYTTIRNLRIKLSDTGSINHVAAYRCVAPVDVNYNYFESASDSATGNKALRLYACPSASVQYNYFTAMNIAISSENGCTVYSNTNDDTGTQPDYGLSVMSGIIWKAGTQPSGSTGDETGSPGIIASTLIQDP